MDVTLLFPILAACSVILVIIIKIFFKIRELLPCSVNCWFCNKNTKVAYHDFNSWICPHCDQYNGFTKDGGYNKIITAQSDEYLNIPTSSLERIKYRRQGPVLCSSCNINQQLKVTQLASFVPFNKNNFDYEIDMYSKQLDKVYDVCEKCEKKITELFEKEKSFFTDVKKMNPNFESPKKLKQIQMRSTLIYYGTVIGCTPLVLEAMCTSVSEDVLISAENYVNRLNILPEWIKTLDYKLVTDVIRNNYIDYNLNIGLIGLCIFIYLIEFIKNRTLLHLLNVIAWVIIISLKYFDSEFGSYIRLLQGLTAAVFLFVNQRSHIKKKNNIKKPKLEKIKNITERFGNDCKFSDRKVPISPDSAFTPIINKSGNLPKPTTIPSSVPEFTTTEKTKKLFSSRRSMKFGGDDFGISNLHLGTRKQNSIRNHSMFEPRSFCGRLSNDNIWNKTSILSPPKLNIDNDRILTSSPSPQSTIFDRSPSQTRCSSHTSGVGSLSSTPQPQETLIDRDFDRFSEMPSSPLNNHHIMTQNSFYTPYDPVCQQVAISPYTYYQFAAMFHRLCTLPPSSQSSFNSSDFNISCNSTKLMNNNNQCKHNVFYIILICIIILCNFMLIGLIYYKEFIAAKV
ncbi:uncharacterized protein LOC142333688 [Lycorma delicatula]|uniref:uncharacterized protein LOC142333688 n=1 Tax=Lycorma delicatula TaxID=130591 RepID=UPI003F5174DF